MDNDDVHGVTVSRAKIKEYGPYYGCGQGDCATEISYEANMLAVYKGEVWCDGCWENMDNPPYDTENDEYLSFGELERFVPEQSREIATLTIEVERLTAENERLREAAQELIDTASISGHTKNGVEVVTRVSVDPQLFDALEQELIEQGD